LKFAIELQAVYLRGTTYLRTPSLGIIPVVTLFVVCAGAVNPVVKVDPWLVDQRVNYGLKNRPLMTYSALNYWRDLDMAFDRSHTSSYSSSIVTTAVSFVIFAARCHA